MNNRRRVTVEEQRRGRRAAIGLGLVAAAFLLLAAASCGAGDSEAPYLDGVSGPQPAAAVDLAGTWGFRTVQTWSCPVSPFTTSGPDPQCVNLPASTNTTIQVPGGGWIKQGFADVAEAVYSRQITVPDIGMPQATKLFFGAVNNQATLTITPTDGGPSRTVGTNTTSFLPSVFDLTSYVKPGATYTISVDVKGRMALRDPAGYYTVPEGASWSPNIAQGIFRSARLEVFPAVYISDAFVRPSVAHHSLSYDVSVTNASSSDQTRWLSGEISSWNTRPWRYPQIHAIQVTVPAGKTQTVTIGPMPWLAGRESYWWPNVPYRAGYRAQLHELKLLLSGGRPRAERPVIGSGSPGLARAIYRFGFREIRQVGDHFELNGIRVNFRGDNLQSADYDSIDHSGMGDSVDTLPGFLAPSAENPGWPAAVSNYLRLNYNDIRVHQLPATPYMLDTADELGLMILDETSIRGSNRQENFTTGQANMVSDVQDLVLRDRNHAAVLRWSQANEPGFAGWLPGAGKPFNQLLYDTVMASDNTRPISTDAFVFTPSTDDLPYSNYTTWCHYAAKGNRVAFGSYTDYPCNDVFLPGKPSGQGEFIWPADNTKQGFEWFATATEKMREQEASDIRPYTLLSAWASVIPGVSTDDLTLEQGGHPIYGATNLPDPWSNPQIKRVQKGFSPVLIADRDDWEANKLSDVNGDWPASPVTLQRGQPTTRTLEVFNDTFSGTRVNVHWQLREDSPAGPAAAAGDLSLLVPLGQHIEQPITFTPPATPGPLYLILSASKPGQGQLFYDASTRFQ